MNNNNNNNPTIICNKKVVVGNCSWCIENQTEIKLLTKQMHGLQRRISELKQDMGCCIHNLGNNNNDDDVHGASPEPGADTQGKVEDDEGSVSLESESSGSDDAVSRSNASSISNSRRKPFTFRCSPEFNNNCPVLAESLIEMKAHMEQVHGWNKFVSFCHICGVGCLTKRSGVRHKLDVHGITCSSCPRKFHSYDLYLKHGVSDHGLTYKQFPCSGCGAIFENKEQVVKHIIITHQIKEVEGEEMAKQLIWSCHQCQSQFLSIKDVQDHVSKFHPHVCGVCGSHFTTFKTIRQHYLGKHGVELEHPSPGSTNQTQGRDLLSFGVKRAKLSQKKRKRLKRDSTSTLKGEGCGVGRNNN